MVDPSSSPAPEKKKLSLTGRILIAMALGAILGVAINLIGNEGWIRAWLTDGILEVVGRIFVAALKLLVVPLVFVSLVCGTAALDDIARLGRVGGKTLLLYLGTTAVAITLALTAAVLVKPGVGFQLDTDVTFEGKEAPSLTETIVDIFPTNPVEAMAEGNMLQIIVFAILFGIAMTLSGDPGQRVLGIFRDLNAIIMKLVMILIELAPYGVFALIARTFGQEGFSAIAPLAKYFFLVLSVLILHAFLTYPLLLKGLGRLRPSRFIGKIRKAQIFAFSTASSNATIPVTMEVCEEELGVDKSVASFTVPLGATINMDGTAIMQGVATVFIAQAYTMGLGITDYLMVILTATLASIGTAGVPGVGLIMLSMVLTQVGLPVEGIGLVLGVDRLLDMVRTAVNITGDASISCIVANSEGKLDHERFNRRGHGSPDAEPEPVGSEA
ncbi:MAG: dicarboxylate/amino acid:cation symporter [Opitutales bacterium]